MNMKKYDAVTTGKTGKVGSSIARMEIPSLHFHQVCTIGVKMERVTISTW